MKTTYFGLFPTYLLLISFKITTFLLLLSSNIRKVAELWTLGYLDLTVRMLQAIWDWVILFLVIYTAIFTPYVAAFLLNEPGYSDRSSESYGSDPIVIIDLIGDTTHSLAWPPAANMTMRRILSFCLNMTI